MQYVGFIIMPTDDSTGVHEGTEHSDSSVTAQLDVEPRTGQDDQEDITTQLQALPGRIWLLPLALLTLFTTWASVAIFGMQESITGIETDAGKFYLLVLVGISASELKTRGELLRKIWLGGGAMLAVIGLLSLWHFNRVVSDAQADLDGNPFGASVQLDIGLELYGAILIGIAIAYVGYNMNDNVTPAVDAI